MINKKYIIPIINKLNNLNNLISIINHRLILIKKFIALLLVAFASSFHLAYNQVCIKPYVNSMAMYHLNRIGLNTELGLALEFPKTLELGCHYKQSSLFEKEGEAGFISMVGVMPNISFVLLDDETKIIKLGAAIGYGNYKRYNSYNEYKQVSSDQYQYYDSFEKSYNSIFIDFLRFKVEFKINEIVRLGFLLTGSFDDGDGSYAAGINLSVILNKHEQQNNQTR